MEINKKTIFLISLFSLNFTITTCSQKTKQLEIVEINHIENFDIAQREEGGVEELDETSILNFVEVDENTGEVKLKPSSIPILQELLDNKERENGFFSSVFKVLGVAAVGLNSFLIFKLFDQSNKNLKNLAESDCVLKHMQTTIEQIQKENLRNTDNLNTHMAQSHTNFNNHKRQLTNLKASVTRLRNTLNTQNHNSARSNTNGTKSQKSRVAQQPKVKKKRIT